MYVKRPLDALVQRIENKESLLQIKRGRGRPEKNQRKTIRKNMLYININESMCLNQTRWRNMIHIADHNDITYLMNENTFELFK